MPTKNPRVNVTFNESDAEVMQIICKKRNLSMSGLIRKVVESWLEDYEDMLLARRAEQTEKEWEEGGRKTISHEELCRELGIKSNMEKEPEETLKTSRKTSKRGSSAQSKKGLRSRRQKLANH